MKQSQKNLLARGVLAALSVATLGASVRLFVHPLSSAAPSVALVVLTAALPGLLRYAGRLGSGSRRTGNSA